MPVGTQSRADPGLSRERRNPSELESSDQLIPPMGPAGVK
jgi:hypothetical protein